MEILDQIRALDPRMLAVFAAIVVVGMGGDYVRYLRARRRVADYLRMHRYTVKRLNRSWRPRITTTRSRHAVHFSVEAYDLEFDVRRRGWARASGSAIPMYEDDVRLEWEGEPDEFGSALPPVRKTGERRGRARQ